MAVIDPVTGKELHPAWRDPKDLPPITDKTEFYIVMLGMKKTDRPYLDIKYRVQMMRINDRVTVIGAAFGFDCPPIVAWQPFPEVFPCEPSSTPST
jgi:hypothetical protein